MPDVGGLAALLPLVGGALLVVLAVAPSTPGGPVDEPAFDPDDVTPGLTGFLVTGAMVVLVILLLLDMSRRLRRIRYRAGRDGPPPVAGGGDPGEGDKPDPPGP